MLAHRRYIHSPRLSEALGGQVEMDEALPLANRAYRHRSEAGGEGSDFVGESRWLVEWHQYRTIIDLDPPSLR